VGSIQGVGRGCRAEPEGRGVEFENLSATIRKRGEETTEEGLDCLYDDMEMSFQLETV